MISEEAKRAARKIINHQESGDLSLRDAAELIDAEFSALRKRNEELQSTLTRLRNEVLGVIGHAHGEIQQAIGVTNMRCLEKKLEESDSVLRVEADCLRLSLKTSGDDWPIGKGPAT